MRLNTQRVAQVKCADLHREGEKRVILGTLMVDVKDVSELVVDGEVNRKIQIYFNTF
jgi:hypothetical protein